MSFWKKLLVSPDKTIIEAIEILHKGGARIVLVVDKELKLLGTVTDGDVRRALISHIDMDSLVIDIMNINPLTVDTNVPKDQVLNMMETQDLLHMPVLDNNEALCDLVTLQQLHKKSMHDNPVFIMAGGFGTRLYPLTKNTPKPLLKVGDKPILDTIIDQFINCGFHNFYISTHFMPEKIKDNFIDKNLSNVTIEFIHEDEPLGTAGALGLLPKNISKLPMIVMNGDLLTKVDFSNLLNFHNENKSQATMCVREYDFQVPYGVVTINGHKIKEINEKPIHKFFVNAGIYVLNHNIVEKIDGNTYLDMTDFLDSELGSGKVHAFPIHEYWLDIGQIDEYKKANQDIYTKF